MGFRNASIIFSLRQMSSVQQPSRHSIITALGVVTWFSRDFFFLMLKRNAVKFMGKWEFGTSYQANENLCWGVTERDSHAGKNLKCYQLLELLNCTSALDFSTFLSFIGCFGTFLSLWSWINYTSFPPGLECSRAAVRLCLFANCSL